MLLFWVGHSSTDFQEVPISLIRRMQMLLVIFLEDHIILGISAGDFSWMGYTNFYFAKSRLCGKQKKSFTESTSMMEFLGFIINSDLMNIYLSQEKVGKIIIGCKKLLTTEQANMER